MTIYFRDEDNKCVEVLDVECVEVYGESFRFKKMDSHRWSSFRSVPGLVLKVFEDELYKS